MGGTGLACGEIGGSSVVQVCGKMTSDDTGPISTPNRPRPATQPSPGDASTDRGRKWKGKPHCRGGIWLGTP